MDYHSEYKGWTIYTPLFPGGDWTAKRPVGFSTFTDYMTYGTLKELRERIRSESKRRP